MEDIKKHFSYAMDIGEQMLISGAEVNRVEDSISRICLSFGVQRVDVFTITSSITATIYGEPFGSMTQTRRILEQSTDFGKLNRLNQLSRDICEKHLSNEEISHRLVELNMEKMEPRWLQFLSYALISGSFSLFFGGSIRDAIVSAGIGIILKITSGIGSRLHINKFLAAFICSVVGGFLAILSVRVGLGESADKINIGNVMLLIPGIALTNAIRDMFSGDIMSGMMRFLEAVLLSMTIAFGFVFSTYLLG